MDEGNAEIGHDFLSEVLRGARDKKVEIDMLEETYQQALSLAAENGWDEDEALLGVFATGIAYLKTRQTLARAEGSASDRAATLQEMAERCMQAESMYSVLKFRAYGMAKDRRILELNVAGLRPDNEGMRQRLFAYREEVAGLRAEVQQLREENRRLKAAQQTSETPDPSAQDARQRGCSLWVRLRSVLRPTRPGSPPR